MLIHVIPKILVTGPFWPEQVQLIDIMIEPGGLVLRDGFEVTTGRPYPNKSYLVACRRRGRRMMDGILIVAPAGALDICVTTRWGIEGVTVQTHSVTYELHDEDYGYATSSMMLWSKRRALPSRYPHGTEGWVPALAQPRMDTEANKQRAGPQVSDALDQAGRPSVRLERFPLPTVPPEVFERAWREDLRFPALEDLFCLPGAEKEARQVMIDQVGPVESP